MSPIFELHSFYQIVNASIVYTELYIQSLEHMDRYGQVVLTLQ